MGVMAQLWAWLFTPSASRRRKAHPDLYPIDAKAIARELRLTDEATRLGKSGMPLPTANTLSSVESMIVQRVEKARQDYVDWAQLRLRVLSADINLCDVTTLVNRARKADVEFVHHASGLMTEHEYELRQLGDVARSRQAELEQFRERNGLTREAAVSTASLRFLKYALLVITVVGEGVLNAGFFAQGLDTGLLGGFAYAALLALLNVMVAFFFGAKLVRFVCHRNAKWRVFGWISAISAMGVMLLIGLGIGHVRDSLTSGDVEPLRAALASLQSVPFVLKDVLSWTLVGVTLIFGIGALLNGFFFDDPYPGYGPLTRNTQAAIDDYEVELQLLRERLETLKQERLNSLDRDVRDAQVRILRFEELLGDKRKTELSLALAFRDAESSLNALLSAFRDENTIARGDAACPSYFSVMPVPRDLPMPAFGISDDERVLTVQRGMVAELLEEVETLRSKVQSAFNQQYDRLKPLDTHFPRREPV